jgi:hypothetical protein
MDNICVQQAWSKDVILQTLENASTPIHQVHVVAHASAALLSLACRYNNNSRLRALAIACNEASFDDHNRAIHALQHEDNLVTGFFANALEKHRLEKIRSNHASNASWQIWGCYAGYSKCFFTDIGDPDIDPYLKRFNLSRPVVPGIAADIAKSLGVICTAARDGLGLEFWHGTPAQQIIRNDTKTPANQPFWLWPTKGSCWVSYNSSGRRLYKPLIFGKPQRKRNLTTPQPPRWLTELFYSE